MSPSDVVIFVEDPGAANYIAALPAALAAQGWRCLVLAAGQAQEVLRAHGVEATPLPQDSSAAALLTDTAPRLLLVGTSENPHTFSFALTTQARLHGIETIGVVDLHTNAESRFRGSSEAALTYAPDWLLVPDRWTQEAYARLGYPAHRLVLCGHPHYDRVRAIGAQLAHEDPHELRRQVVPGVSATRAVVVFLAETSSGLRPQQYQRSAAYTLSGRGRRTERTAVVLEEFLDAVALLHPAPYLVLRLHPKNTRQELRAYVPAFDAVSQGGLPYELVYVADLVVGMTTSLLLEASLLGRQTLSIVPRREEQYWLPGLQDGAIPCVTTRQALRQALRQWHRPGRARAALPPAVGGGNDNALDKVMHFLQQRLQALLATRPHAA
ncbi:MAG: hypothetical protein AB7N91_14360 [Candidatus Tectimicrobiota bacterium]